MADRAKPDNNASSSHLQGVFQGCIDQLEQKKLVIMQAPEGFGKSQLLMDLRSHYQQQCIFIDCGSCSGDPKAFFDHLIKNFQASGHSLSTYEQQKILNAEHTQLAYLLSQALPQKKMLMFAFQDMHLIENNITLNILHQFVGNTNNNIRFIISSNRRLLLNFDQLMVNNQIHYLTTEHFLVDNTTAASLLEIDANLDANQTLLMTCQGWLKSLTKAKTLLTQGYDALQTVDRLKTTEFYQFFYHRILATVSKEMQIILVATSCVDRFTHPQVEFVIKQLSGKSPLGQLSGLLTEQTFISSYHQQGHHWYQFHPLFHVFLNSQIDQHFDQQQIHAIKRTAACWLFEQGLIAASLDVILDIEDYRQAEAWLVKYADQAKHRGYHQSLLQYLQRMPESYLEKNPDLASAYILCLVLTKKFLLAGNTQTLLATIAVEGKTNQRYKYNALRQAPLLSYVTAFLEDRLENIQQPLNAWFTEWRQHPEFIRHPDYHFEMGIAYLALAYVHKSYSQFEPSEQAFNDARKSFEAYQSDYGIAWTDCLHVLLLAKQGLHQEALDKALSALEFCRRHLDYQVDIQAMLCVQISAIYYEQFELEKARQYFPQETRLIDGYGYTDIMIAGYQTEIALQLIDGTDSDVIFSQLKTRIQNSLSNKLPRLAYNLINDLIMLLIRKGKITEANEYARTYKIHDLTSPQTKFCYRAHALLLISNDELTLAHEFITKRIASYQAGRRYRVLAEFYILLTIVENRRDLEQQAQVNLINALNICGARNYIAIFSNYSAELKDLFINNDFSALISPDIKAFYLKVTRILYNQRSDEALFEKLTKKEIQVINLAESGDTTEQLAQAMHISQGTFKWHLHNIYQKLKVKNRTQAINQARKLGYICQKQRKPHN